MEPCRAAARKDAHRPSEGPKGQANSATRKQVSNPARPTTTMNNDVRVVADLEKAAAGV